MVLYRKYRPQKLSELDSEEVRTRLTQILSSSYTPHAFLFAGPKGTGKTSAARIIAKVLNCEQRIKHKEGSVEPCNACDTCLAITSGYHLDILEIDAASNRGIEEIRDLREKIKLAPVSAHYKVYIIDEVHMLTKEAFNALLKTLEEPPPHAIFILATTEAQRLPSTIISRCIRLNFNKASDAEITRCLKRVISGEKISVSAKLLALIADVSDGSFRDATKILEQAILEQSLTEDKLTKLLGRQVQTSEKFLRLFSSRNITMILAQISKMADKGTNFRFLVEDVLNILHDMLLVHYRVKRDKNNQLSKLFPKKSVLLLIKLFSRVYIELKNTNMPHLPLEVAAVEWCEGK